MTTKKTTTVLCTLLAGAVALAAVRAAFAQADATAGATSKPATQPAGLVDYKKLKEMLPEKLAGLKRAEATGERTGFGDIKISTARASYTQDANKGDAPHIELQIFDYGTNKQMLEGMSVWTKMDVDREGDEGFSKSLKIQDQPAMQTYINEGKAGQIQLLVGERFLMSINTTNLSVEQFKKLGDELKLKELAALK